MEIIHNWGFLALKVESPDAAMSREEVLRALALHPLIRGLLEDRTLESSCALINAELVVSKLHLGAAVMRLRHVMQNAKIQALAHMEVAPMEAEAGATPKRLPLTSLLGNLRTKKLPSEMLLMLSPNKNISTAMKQFSFIETLPADPAANTKQVDVAKRKPALSMGTAPSTTVVFILGMYRPPQNVIGNLLDTKVRPFLQDSSSAGKKGEKRARSEGLLIEVLPLSKLPQYANEPAIRSVFQVTPQEERAMAPLPVAAEFEGELMQRFGSVSPTSFGAFPAPTTPTMGSHISGLEGAVLNRIAVCDV